MTTELNIGKEEIPGITTYGQGGGDLRLAVAKLADPQLMWATTVRADTEVIELAQAVETLQAAAEKYIEYLRDSRESGPPLTRKLTTNTLNNLKAGLFELGKLENDLSDAIQIRQETDTKTKMTVLRVAEIE